MRYIAPTHIAKKCPKGTWLDKKTGKCIPIDEWKSKYGGKRERTDEKENKPKKCPKGKWRDPKTGECVSQDEWRRRNQKKYRDKEKTKEDDSEGKKDFPKYIEHREIKRYERASDIDTSEAEWIFNQGSSSEVWDKGIEKAKKKSERIANGLLWYKRKNNDNEEFHTKEVFDILAKEDNFSVEEVADKAVGGRIWFNKKYRYQQIKKIDPTKSIGIIDGIAKGLAHMPCLADTKIEFGAMDSEVAGGACWSNPDGSCEVRFDVACMNRDKLFPDQYYIKAVVGDMSNFTSRVFGYYDETTAVHEITHSYINKIAHDALVKGYNEHQIDRDYSTSCDTITSGKIPKTMDFDEDREKPILRTETASDNYVVFGRFTQNVVKDAMYVAEKIYGMDEATFMNQMTSYGQTKPKEGIPEAVSDYICNGEKATLANKLIYFSLQRYAKFVYDPDQKDLPSIKVATKDLIKRQKRPKNKKKSSIVKDITFKEILESDL